MTSWWARAKIAGSLAALAGSFAMSAVTWIGIGGIAGYGPMRYMMPLVVDAYIVTAIATGWCTSSTDITRSAYRHALGAAAIGTFAQAIYHSACTWTGIPMTLFGWHWDGHEYRNAIWAAILAFIAGGLPASFAFLGVRLHGMGQREAQTTADPATEKPPVPAASQPASLPQAAPAPLATAPVITSPATPEPAATPVTAAPAPSMQPPRPEPEQTRRGPNMAAGGTMGASRHGSEDRLPRETRERPPTRAGRTVPEDMQERIYRMLRAGSTHTQIAEDCDVSPRTVANYSRRMRERQIAAVRQGNGRMVPR